MRDQVGLGSDSGGQIFVEGCRMTGIGERVCRPPLDEGENFFKCDRCGGWFDARDLAWVEDYEGVLPHPPMDQRQ